MAIFGRRSARQRLRTAVSMRPGLSSRKRSSPPAEPMRPGLSSRKRSSPPAEPMRPGSLPPFTVPPDCTPWVLGDLWPTELQTVTAETATLAEYLDADLRRIVASANDKLLAIRRSEPAGPERSAVEARIINAARAFAELRVESTIRQLGNEPNQRAESGPATPDDHDVPPEPPDAVAEEPLAEEPAEADEQRLRRLLEFVARQEPGLRWAVGTRADGSTVLVTDLAHGWIPPGIELPAGVCLLEPGRRSGKAVALLGAVTASATYAPGDRLGRQTDFGPTDSAMRPRELPAIDDLGSVLGQATHLRDGLPLLVHALATAGTAAADTEIDLLRVHLDTARYRLLAYYPDLDSTLLLNCLLLAATAAAATGDQVSANYHLAWFRALNSD